DNFVFRPGMGNDKIADFSGHNGQGDHIQIDNFPIDSFDDLRLEAINNNHDTLIRLTEGNSITLQGVGMDALASDDFIFHPLQPPPGVFGVA
ncbi:MAG: hypothetical protein K8F62_02530, partial [Pseudorhodoplanes sp.]|nr:hypothetical protein [Pseudorhodoplanes sp.]